MKILHLTHTDLRYDNRILKELEVLSNLDNYNVFALGVFLQEDAAFAPKILRANIYNINLFFDYFNFLPRPIKYLFNIFEISIRFFVKSLMIKPDVVHCHDTMVLPVGTLIKIIFGSTLIYDAHELESQKNGQSKALSKATLVIEKMCWNYIDHLISVSDSIINWYNSNFVKVKSTLILNSPVIGNYDILTRNRYFHDLYKIPDEKLVFVYLGYFGKGRSIEEILNAFINSNVRSHVVFVGYGELSNLIAKYSTEFPNIHIHNAVSHDRIVELIRSADVGFCLLENVSLSDYFALPNKLFEYIFAGTPVIASDFPELSATVKKYNLGVLSLTDSESIKKSIYEIENNSIARVQSNLYLLSWEYQKEKLLKVYNSIGLNQNFF